MSFVDWFMASFLYCSYSYCSSNYCDSNSCRSFTLLKALAKSNGNLSLSPLRARKSDNYRYRDSWKSDNFRESHKKKEKKLIPKRIKVIILQGAIENSTILLSQYCIFFVLFINVPSLLFIPLK